MGRHMRTRNKGDMLDRIVILLLALASLAERAAGAPGPVRCLVLWPLRRADAIAGAFVAGFAFDSANRLPSTEAVCQGNDPTDALTLALSLRTLALTLQAIIAQMRLSSLHPRSSDAKDRSICQLIQILGHSRFAQARRADTS